MCAAIDCDKRRTKSKSLFGVFNRILSAVASKQPMLSKTDAYPSNDLQNSSNGNIPQQLNMSAFTQMVENKMNRLNQSTTVIETQNNLALNHCNNVHIGDNIYLPRSNSQKHGHNRSIKNRANKMSTTDTGKIDSYYLRYSCCS